MPTTTWSNMRARIARAWGYRSVTTSGNHIEANTVTSESLIPLFPNTDLLKNWYLAVHDSDSTENGKVRLISASTTAGALTTSNPAFTADNNARTVAVYRFFEPAEILTAFQDAAADLFPGVALVDDNRTTFIVPGQRVYDVPVRQLNQTILLDRGSPGGGDGCWVGFDGFTGLITITDATILQNTFDGGATAEAWIYTISDGESNAGAIFAKDDATTWFLIVENESSDTVRLNFFYDWDGTNGQWRTDNVINLQEWTHVAVSYDADDAGNVPVIYVNGVSVTITAVTTPTGTRVTDANINLIIGANSAGGSTFHGFIDEPRIWKDTRTAAEISADKDDHLTGSFAMAGYWPMDAGNGLTVYDRSGNGNDGTISGAGAMWHDNRRWEVVHDAVFSPPHSGGAGGYITLPASYVSPSDGVSNKMLRFEGLDLLTSPTADTSTIEVDGELLDLVVNKARQILAEQRFSEATGAVERGRWAEQAQEFERRVERELNNGRGLSLVSRRPLGVPDA